MTEEDIDKAASLMPALLDQLNRESKQWKRREVVEAPVFDKCLLPDAPSRFVVKASASA